MTPTEAANALAAIARLIEGSAARVCIVRSPKNNRIIGGYWGQSHYFVVRRRRVDRIRDGYWSNNRPTWGPFSIATWPWAENALAALTRSGFIRPRSIDQTYMLPHLHKLL